VAIARAPRDARLDLTVVVPVYNNAASLALLCGELKSALDPLGIAYELLFVNDGSTDGSAACLAKLAEQHAEVTVVELNGNFGQQVAVLCGLERASGASCVVMDADLQDPPSALPLLWSARSAAAPVVFAARRGRYQSYGRHLTSLMYRTLLNLLTGLPREASMYVLMDRPLVEDLLAFPTRYPSIPAMIGSLGVPAATRPVERRMRVHGRSAYTSLARVRAALAGLACVFGHRLGVVREPYLKQRGSFIVAEVRGPKGRCDGAGESVANRVD
jgi:glycosyltransferase involved in cell wall biosynthesis